MDGEPELLDSGRPDEEGALRRLRRAHPRAAVGALVIAGVAGVVGVVGLAVRALVPPNLDSLAVDAVLVMDDGSGASPQDAKGVGEVLRRDLRITVTAPGLDPRADPWQVAAVGLDGPGIVDLPQAAERRTEELGSDVEAYLALSASVDCGAIPLPVRRDAYGLRIRGSTGDADISRVVPLGRAGDSWARLVERDCAEAEAVRTVRVVSVEGLVDPTRPIVDLEFLVDNRGPHVVEVLPEGDAQRSFLLAPGTRRTVSVRRTLDPCPNQDPEWGGAFWPSGIGVVVAGAVAVPSAWDRFGRPEAELEAAASESLGRLLSEACAGLPWLRIEAPAATVRYDPVTQVLEGTVVVTPPEEWVGRLSVGPASNEETGLTVEALWQAAEPTGPTESGASRAVVVPVRYRITPGEAFCGEAGLVVNLDVQTRVPAGAAERTARLQGYVEIPWPAGVDSGELCQR